MLILKKAVTMLKKGSYEEYDNEHEHADEYGRYLNTIFWNPVKLWFTSNFGRHKGF